MEVVYISSPIAKSANFQSEVSTQLAVQSNLTLSVAGSSVVTKRIEAASPLGIEEIV